MHRITLYRGIAVAAEDLDEVVKSIRQEGLAPIGKTNDWRQIQERIEELLSRPDLDTSITRNERHFANVTFACGDREGAAYYACRGGSADAVRLVVRFCAESQDVCVDGRDFLAPVFQLFDAPQISEISERTSVLCELFGPSIRKYWELAISRARSELGYRLALHDLACADSSVISDHARNRSPILGRHLTRFCSAFFVRSPVRADQVASIEEAAPADIPEVELDLRDFLRRGITDGPVGPTGQ